MKTNQRTIKVYDTSHALAGRLSNKYGISMAALVELGLRQLEKGDTLVLPARDKRSAKSNARKVIAKAKVAK